MSDPIDKRNTTEPPIERPQPWMFDMAAGIGEENGDN